MKQLGITAVVLTVVIVLSPPPREGLTLTPRGQAMSSSGTTITATVQFPDSPDRACLGWELLESSEPPYKNERITVVELACREDPGRMWSRQYRGMFPGRYAFAAWAERSGERYRYYQEGYFIAGR